MTILVLSVGRPDASHFGALCDDYAMRIRRFGVDLDVRWVKDVREGGKYADAHVREREARALRDALPDGARVVALDPGGRAVTTEMFARRLESWASGRVAFVIGGPLGLAPAFAGSAHETLSLSGMTLPHELARVVLLEQVYRAITILRGVPYHK